MLKKNTFEGVRVVEVAQFVFVPGAATLLADLGAEVIKVESPGEGDPYRTMALGDGREREEVNIALEQNNRGKKSIGIDLKSSKGRDIFRRLIETADVFATSMRPQALERLKLGPEDIREWNPKIIYARCNGFGFEGPDRDKPGYDATAFWMRSGFATAHMHSDHVRPIRARGGTGDHSGSLAVAYGIAAALFKRERTGESSLVEISLLGTGMWVLSHDITLSQHKSYDPLLRERRARQYPLTENYRTRDGRWIQFMLLDPDRHWGNICRTLEIEQYIDDPRFTTNSERAKHGEECTRIIAEAIAARDWAEWKPRFERLDAPWELIQNIDELLTDRQAVANGYVVDSKMSDGRYYKVISGPVIVNGEIPTTFHRAPNLGEHTVELLNELGVAPAVRDLLMKEGVIQ